MADNIFFEDISAFEYFIVYEGLTIITQIIRTKKEIKNNTYSKSTILYCQMHMSQQLRFLSLIFYPTAPFSWILLIFAQSLLYLYLKMKFKEKLLVTKAMRSILKNRNALLTVNIVVNIRGKQRKSRQTIDSRNLTIFDKQELDEICCLCNKYTATTVGSCFHVCICKKCHLKQV